ncbi:hypothetical protein SORBI_3006G028800 [Sorghum bicolor]|uniref:Protein kinase domain-containing protein n=1 Tax=Sorghum bicolor TaxID=4558 RepID=A0A1Z5RCV6_SORBI|nr:hypothetical protein SORBI_3006G028800 [Sorghum bicolor]
MAAVNSLLLLVLLVAAVHSATLALGQTVKVWSLCSPANYTPGDAYDANLRGMLKDLVTVTASYGGNGNSTVGGDNGPADHQSSYGLAICYADAPPEVCRLCLAMAAGNVTLACPRAVAADMMYNNCLLRYANASFPASPDMAQRWTRGGRAYSLTCYTRFEVMPFYTPPSAKTIVVEPAPPPEPSPAGTTAAAKSRDGKSRKFPSGMVVLAVSTLGAILLIMVCVIFVFKIRRRGKFQQTIRVNSTTKQNIEELLEDYGSLAPKRYKYSQLKEITRYFSEKLGEGGYGMVYKGTLPCGMLVAVKFLHDFTRNGEDFINEVFSIRRTSHVNIVTLLGFCLEGSKRALIYEYMANGSLDKFIYDDNSKTIMGWDKLYEIAIGIARGLEYLHRGCNTRIIHFDIKPHNILLDDDFISKIADFGLAKLCNPKESYLSMAGMRGTIGFIAPEVFARRFGVVSTKSDVYSYGMMLLEMVGGRKNLKESVNNSSEMYFPDFIYSHLAEVGSLHTFDMAGETEEMARKMASIGLWCIQVSPMSRPTMSKVLEMFEKSADQLEIPPRQHFYSAIQEDSSEESAPTL